MVRWVVTHAPDEMEGVDANQGRHNGHGLRPTYERLRREYDRELVRAMKAATRKQLDWDGWELTCRRVKGRFVARWVRVEG